MNLYKRLSRKKSKTKNNNKSKTSKKTRKTKLTKKPKSSKKKQEGGISHIKKPTRYFGEDYIIEGETYYEVIIYVKLPLFNEKTSSLEPIIVAPIFELLGKEVVKDVNRKLSKYNILNDEGANLRMFGDETRLKQFMFSRAGDHPLTIELDNSQITRLIMTTLSPTQASTINSSNEDEKSFKLNFQFKSLNYTLLKRIFEILITKKQIELISKKKQYEIKSGQYYDSVIFDDFFSDPIAQIKFDMEVDPQSQSEA